MDNWIPFQQIDFNDTSLNSFHIDTRDFHCTAHSESYDKTKIHYHTLKKYPHFFYTVDEVKAILNRLYTESSGENEWRMLQLDGEAEIITSNWRLKYIRIYRTESGFLICTANNYAIKKPLLDCPVNQKYLSAHTLGKKE